MPSLIFMIIIIWIIVKKINKNEEKTNQPRNTYPLNANTVNGSRNARNANARQNVNNVDNGNNRQEPLSEAQIRYQQRLKEYEEKKKTAQKTDIVSRAKSNTEKLKDDETLSELELSHNHSEKQIQKPVEHSTVCRAHEVRDNSNIIEPGESVLGSVEDLMVKGFSGNMSFERDFVGEAMDMVANFSLQKDVLSTNINDMKKGA